MTRKVILGYPYSGAFYWLAEKDHLFSEEICLKNIQVTILIIKHSLASMIGYTADIDHLIPAECDQ